MNSCMVCNGASEFYFEKDFQGINELHKVEYYRCVKCGFVYSKTHFDMSLATWEKLNYDVHAAYQGNDYSEDDPNWITRMQAQSACLKLFHDERILPHEPWLDYACGDGKLTDFLRPHDIVLAKYDKYMKQDDSYISDGTLREQAYNLVVSTSFLEHILSINPFEEMVSLLSGSGVLAIHTLVMETIPRDPDWFYLFPVHVSFYSNKSMQHLFQKWGFEFCVYHLPSRMWFWYKKLDEDIVEKVSRLKSKHPQDYFYSTAFVDYWK